MLGKKFSWVIHADLRVGDLHRWDLQREWGRMRSRGSIRLDKSPVTSWEWAVTPGRVSRLKLAGKRTAFCQEEAPRRVTINYRTERKGIQELKKSQLSQQIISSL